MKVILVFISIFQCFDTSIQDVQCPRNHFKLREMENCHSYLSCSDLENMILVRRIGSGAVKDVFLADWKNMSIAISVPVNQITMDDFMNGVETLRLLNPSKFVVQYLGICETTRALFTEYYPNGDAHTLFSSRVTKLSLMQSIQFCHQYSQILKYLHNSPAGPRVLCDSNSLDKLLSQLLVTFDFKLILNDVDALPQIINGSGIKCGHRQLFGAFVAPEQLWQRNDQFNDLFVLNYNEKTDIWKAPAVCEYFLKLSSDGDVLRYRLFDLHKKCRNTEPSKRPTAEDLVNEYETVIKELINHSEL